MSSGASLFGLCVACSALLASACAHDARPTTTPQPAVQTATPSAAALFERGSQLASQGQYPEAESALSQALSAGHPAARVLPVLLDVCRDSGRPAAGVEYAAPYLQLNPADFQLRYRVALLLLDLGAYERARSELSRVLDTAPNYAPAHYALALTLRDHFHDDAAAARHFAAYHRLQAQGQARRPTSQRSSVL
ncbi:MAG TPA: tetratricopeptide repeat protein [Polyangiales bacterium]|nr:tetratricopeptide repeat protein [Polyangiales bacterium]